VKPNPFDEAVSLIWYLENVFYSTSGDMVHYLQKKMFSRRNYSKFFNQIRFWPEEIVMETL
jgi:phosphoenolpyruvate carboxylase